jgi:hypothetical protein
MNCSVPRAGRLEGSKVITGWWLLLAFIGGGSAGILLMALMRMAGDSPEQSGTFREGTTGSDPIRIPGRNETFCSFRCRDCFVDTNRLSQADGEDRQFVSQHFERTGQQIG